MLEWVVTLETTHDNKRAVVSVPVVADHVEGAVKQAVQEVYGLKFRQEFRSDNYVFGWLHKEGEPYVVGLANARVEGV